MSRWLDKASIEAVESQQINHLLGHHVVGADDAAHLAVNVLGQRGELEVEADVGLRHGSSQFQ